MINPEGENPLLETDLSSNNDKRWPEGTPSEKALRRIIVRSEIKNEQKLEPPTDIGSVLRQNEEPEW